MIISFETINLFFLTAVALALVPGPDNIFVLTHSALHGRIAGLLVTVGLCTGVMLHTAFVGFGMAAIFAASAIAFSVFKMFGVAYLLYLAFGAFREGAKVIDRPRNNFGLSRSALYTRGVIMNLTNPKVAIFFLAFLPQFTDPRLENVGVQIINLGVIFILATFLIFGSIAWFSGYIGEFLRKSKYAQVLMHRIAGIIFIGLAVRLIIPER